MLKCEFSKVFTIGCCSYLRMIGCRKNVDDKNFKLFSVRKDTLEDFQLLLANSRDTYLGETTHVQFSMYFQEHGFNPLLDTARWVSSEVIKKEKEPWIIIKKRRVQQNCALYWCRFSHPGTQRLCRMSDALWRLPQNRD